MTESFRRDLFAVIICKNMLRQVIFFLAEIAQQNIKVGEKQRVQGTLLLSKKLSEEDSLTRLFLCYLDRKWLASTCQVNWASISPTNAQNSSVSVESGLSGFYHYHKRCYVLSRRQCQSAKVFGIQDESPKTFERPSSYVTVKQLDKISLNFSSSSFVIRVNLLHPCPPLYLDGLFLSLWRFSIFVKY